MKIRLPHLFALSLCLGAVHAQTETETEAATEAPAKELREWEQGFLNLPEEKRNEYAKHLAKSRELFQQKRIFECIDELEKAKEIYADSPDLENLLGACQVEFRSFDKAMEHFNRANELQPDTTSILFNIAEVHFVSRRWEQAEKALGDLVAKQDEDANGMQMMMDRLIEFKLMLTKIKLGKIDEARAMAERYDHLDDSPFHYYSEAALAFHDGDELAAESAIARAARVFREPAIISPWQDTMMEFGYVKSFFGGDLPEEE